MLACCMLQVACCVLHVACCMLHVGCWMLHGACCSNLTILSGKIKIRWKRPWLESSVRYHLFYLLFFFFLKTFFCFANIPFQFKNLLQKWKLVSLSISFSGISGHILEKKVASTKKKEGIFFSFSRKKGVHFFKLKGHIFFMIVLCWCMKCVK